MTPGTKLEESKVNVSAWTWPKGSPVPVTGSLSDREHIRV